MRRASAFVFAVLLAAGATPARARADSAPIDPQRKRIREEIATYLKDQKSDVRVFWKDGLDFETRDKTFRLAIGGRVQLDTWYFDDDSIQSALDAADDPATAAREPWDGVWHSGYELRRVRLYVKGTLWKHTAFKTQLDFAGGGVAFNDVFLELVDLDACFGCLFPDVTIGHMKEPFSLSGMTSANVLTFIERPPVLEALWPARNTGVSARKSLYGDRLTWAVGFFGHGVGDAGDSAWYEHGSEGGYDVTGRVTVLPWAPCGCESRFLEVGASASYQDGFGTLRYRARPATHLGSRIVDTGTFPAESVVLVGGEMAFGYDRWHAQAEWIGAFVSSGATGDPTVSGWYAEASYMLNGPNRPFKRSSASFSAVRPCRSFLQDCSGLGAFEVAARYATLDLTDQGLAGGEVDNVTVGLNWYLDVNTRISIDYVFTQVDRLGIDEDMSGLGFRFQLWF